MGRPALSARTPSTKTSPAMMRARAFSPVSAKPFSTIQRSSRIFSTVSGFAPHDEIRDLVQPFCGFAEDRESLVRAGAFCARHCARAIEAVDGGEGDFALGFILAGGFAEGFGRFLDVEDIVHNLKGEAGMLAVLRERVELRGVRTRGDAAHANAGAKKSAGLGAMDAVEQFGRWLLTLAFDIGHLSADHAIDCAGGEGELADQRDDAGGLGVVHDAERLDREREEGIAGEDRHGFSEYFVAGGLAAPEIVVIERREIVVYQ